MTLLNRTEAIGISYLLGGGIPPDAFGPAPSPFLPVTFDDATTRALTQARTTRVRRIQTSASLTAEVVEISARKLREAVVSFLESVIRGGGIGYWADIDANSRSILDSVSPVLVGVAEDENALVNVRGLAARLAVALSPSTAEQLGGSPSISVRLGVVLGLADAEQWDALARFLDDPSTAVAAEAQFLLEDAG